MQHPESQDPEQDDHHETSRTILITAIITTAGIASATALNEYRKFSEETHRISSPENPDETAKATIKRIERKIKANQKEIERLRSGIERLENAKQRVIDKNPHLNPRHIHQSR